MSNSLPQGSPPMLLYTAPLSMFAMKVEIALREKNLAFERVSVAYSAADGYHPKNAEVLRVNPKRQVPVLIHGDLELFDSTQIFEYLEDLAPVVPLWPSPSSDRARARLLEHTSDEVFFPHIIKLMGLQEDLKNPVAVTAIDSARDYYLEMECVLGVKQFLVGEFSYADIAFYMAQLFAERMGALLTEACPRLTAWRERVSARPSVPQTLAPMIAHLREHGRPVPGFVS